MRIIIVMLVFLTACGIATIANSSEKDAPHVILDGVLSRHVSNDGLVNYRGLKEDKEFVRYIEYLSDTDPDDLPSERHRLAFWINAYNAFVLKGVLDEYPIESVLDVGWIPHSFFIRKKFKTRHGKITLRTIENKKIRGPFKEPRIHFAINCASLSCPKLLSEAYRAEKLEQQLESQARRFINNKSKNFLDRESGTLYLSSIFKWFKGDFINSSEKIEDFVAKYIDADDAELITKNKVRTKYLDYNWGLNEQK